VAALQCDPVEKKPFFHALPGSRALSFGMLGCDMHCAYCQNWLSSQALRDPKAGGWPTDISPGRLAGMAVSAGARIVASTYNEPLITSEWAAAVFKEAEARGLVCAFVSNGNATERVLDYLRPCVDLFKVDLKTFNEARYRELGARLGEVLSTIRLLHLKGFWVEVVTLVVPGLNDADEELKAMARFLSGVSRDIPWHLTAFHPDYRLPGAAPTRAARLSSAARLGREEGLRYVYAGNLPGGVGGLENTYCPGCGLAVVERAGFEVLADRLRGGSCPQCGAAVPGRWA
jgi:pyruvate formate lyase activating enzyme